MTVFGSHDWSGVAPIVLLALTGLLVLVLDLCIPTRVRRNAALAAAGLGTIVAGLTAGLHYHAFQTAGSFAPVFGGAFSADGFAIVFEEIILLAVFFTLSLAYGLGREDQSAGGIALLLWSACGAMLAAGAGDLMTIFLGIELASLALYCLARSRLEPRRANPRSSISFSPPSPRDSCCTAWRCSSARREASRSRRYRRRPPRMRFSRWASACFSWA